MNLLGMLQDQVTGQLASQASKLLGEKESGITSALGGAFPAILGSVINKSADKEGAAGLMDMIGGVDGGMLDNIGDLFGGGESSVSKLSESGGGMLDMLLGDKMGGVTDLISKVGGIKSGSAGTLMKMATPFLIGMIGKQIKGKGIGGLMDLLGGQKEHVAAAMPSGMGSLLGLGGLLGGASKLVGNITDTGKSAATATAGMAGSAVNAGSKIAGGVVDSGKKIAGGVVDSGKKTGSSMMKWLIPAIVIIGLIALLSRTKACSGTAVGDAMDETTEAVGGAMEGTADMVKDGANAVGSAMSSALQTVNEAGKTALQSITFAAGSAGENMMAFINGGAKEGNGTFRFNNLSFPTGSAAISAETASEVDNIASILKAYTAVNIEIQGHTDNTGDAGANLALSQARADAVKARLSTQGIPAARVNAVGYGDKNPVTTNDSEEGRIANRRVEVKITN